MGFADKPQRLWWRKLLFQVHLWTGIGLGLYILLMSVTGAALVFRHEIESAAEPRVTAGAAGEPVGFDRLKAAAEGAYPGYRVAWFLNKEDPREPVEVWLERDGDQKTLLFDPLTGEDLGPKSGVIGFLQWLADLHFYLLSGETGLMVNGFGAGFLVLMALTGAVIWWPGKKNWRRSLTVNTKAKWKRLNWNLHSAMGFWTLAFVLIWAVTGVYFAFPEPFRQAVAAFAPLKQFQTPPPPPESDPEGEILPVSSLIKTAEATVPGRVTTWIGLPHHEGETAAYIYRQETYDLESPSVSVVLNAYTGEVQQLRDFNDLSLGDTILRWFGYLHFGNFGGVPVKIAWTILGLAPAALFVTGALMYWNRVLSKRWRRIGAGRRMELPQPEHPGLQIPEEVSRGS